MDVNQYKNSAQFPRNEAIYVLYKLDSTPTEELALSFNLDLTEINSIIATHEQYVNALQP